MIVYGVTCCVSDVRFAALSIVYGQVYVLTPAPLVSLRTLLETKSYMTGGAAWARELGSWAVDGDWKTENQYWRAEHYGELCHKLIVRRDGTSEHEVAERVGWSLVRKLAKEGVFVAERTRAHKRGRLRLRKRVLRTYIEDAIVKLWAEQP